MRLSNLEQDFPMDHEDQDDKEMRDPSEYETGSEWDPDFHSENEPPQDKIHEERLIIKNASWRLFKKIIKLGLKGDMPSKYNKVTYRCLQFDKETLEIDLLSQASRV